jgi:phage-related protein
MICWPVSIWDAPKCPKPSKRTQGQKNGSSDHALTLARALTVVAELDLRPLGKRLELFPRRPDPLNRPRPNHRLYVVNMTTKDIAKPLKGFGAGVLELALRFHGDAYRVVYALRLGGGDAVWVVHAFQKKSKTGIKTPKAEIDLIHERLNG